MGRAGALKSRAPRSQDTPRLCVLVARGCIRTWNRGLFESFADGRFSFMAGCRYWRVPPVCQIITYVFRRILSRTVAAIDAEHGHSHLAGKPRREPACPAEVPADLAPQVRCNKRQLPDIVCRCQGTPCILDPVLKPLLIAAEVFRPSCHIGAIP